MARKKRPDWLGAGFDDLLDFKRNARNPASWWERSVVLQRAANVVWAEFYPTWRKCFPEEGSPSQQDRQRIRWPDLMLLGVWRMLSGMSLESAAKALLVVKQPRRAGNGRFDLSGIANGGHDLGDLFREVYIRVDDYEAHVLEELTESVVWMERYPVPLKREHMTMTKTNVERWPSVVTDLLARIKEQIPGLQETEAGLPYMT